MSHQWDEFSKSLAESVPRRESLRRLGAVFAGAVLAPLWVATARDGGPDPCKTFCKCRNKTQQNACLDVCKACNRDTKRIAGTCGNYTCCAKASCDGVCSDLKSDPNCGTCGNNCSALGYTCCANNCADLRVDVFNCGACGAKCAAPPPGEVVACVSGTCVYDCALGTIDCGDGTCTSLAFDADNCGACGNVCDATAPFCTYGTCTATYCNGADLDWDANNCGTCGYQCSLLEHCSWGVCEGSGYDY